MDFKNATLEITTRIGCSINCKFCPQDKLIKRYFEQNESGEKSLQNMSFETFKTCIDKVPKEVMIDFAGMCEPWLNPECTKMVQYASGKGHEIRIYSTLVGMKEEDIEILNGLNIKSFVLHTPDEAENSHIKIDEQYKNVLRRLMEIRLDSLKAISSHSAIHPAIRNIISDDWVQDNAEMIDRAGNLEGDEVEHYSIEGSLSCNTCGWRLNHNILLPDGRVLLCCNDYGIKHVLGNLLYVDYEDLFKGEEYIRVRNAMATGDGDILCKSCSNANTLEKLTEKYISLAEEKDEIYRESQIEIKKLNKNIQKITEAKEWSEKQNRNIEEQLKKNGEEAQKQIKNLMENGEELQKQIKDLKEWIAQLEEARDFFKGQMENFQNEYQKACERSDTLLKEFQTLQSKEAESAEKIKSLEEEISTTNNQTEEQVEKLEHAELEAKKWKYKYNRLMSDKAIEKIARKKNLDI